MLLSITVSTCYRHICGIQLMLRKTTAADVERMKKSTQYCTYTCKQQYILLNIIQHKVQPAYTCTNTTRCKDEQCSPASMWCKRIGSVQMTLTWRPLLERVRESRYTNPYLPSGRERCTETETRNKRAKIKRYWDVNWSWRVSCSVRRV